MDMGMPWSQALSRPTVQIWGTLTAVTEWQIAVWSINILSFFLLLDLTIWPVWYCCHLVGPSIPLKISDFSWWNLIEDRKLGQLHPNPCSYRPDCLESRHNQQWPGKDRSHSMCSACREFLQTIYNCVNCQTGLCMCLLSRIPHTA
jgi:hypothetical protein